MKLRDDREASICHFREAQIVWYKTGRKKAKIKKIWNNKVDKGKMRMFDLEVDHGTFKVPTQCFEYEIEEIKSC